MSIPQHEPSNRISARTPLMCNALLLGMLVVSRPAAGEPAPEREDVDLRQQVEDLNAQLDALRRRLASEVRLETDAYLGDRGVGGHTFTDSALRPLNDTLRRTVLGGGITASHECWNNLVGGDACDHLSVRLRTNVGFALTSGVEIDTEFQQLIQRGGIFQSSPLDATQYLPPPNGAWSLSPSQALHPDAPLEVLRAELRLPSFNLLGRLAHVPVTAVVGRQALAFDDGFVLGDDASGRGMTWDGVRMYGESGTGTRLDVFAGRIAVGASTALSHMDALADPQSDPPIEIAGIHARMRGVLPDTSVSCYYLHSLTDASTPVTSPPYNIVFASRLHTVGVTAETDLAQGVEMTLRAAVQSGTYGTRTVREAWAGEAVLNMRNATGSSRATLAFAHATGDGDPAGTYQAFTPIAQDPRRWDQLGLLTSKNVALWSGEYDQALSHSATFGVRITRATAPEPSSPAGMMVVAPAPPGGGAIGNILTLYLEWELYEDEASSLRIAYTHFTPEGYLPEDAADARALSVAVEASF